ncbi:hypothetical protein GQ54DRAFT_214982 [Martensiomyces pterosporus]|nr:hypothetical protein GQ54DRAFT_214982 [Martensiomyces pterosporus]
MVRKEKTVHAKEQPSPLPFPLIFSSGCVGMCLRFMWSTPPIFHRVQEGARCSQQMTRLQQNPCICGADDPGCFMKPLQHQASQHAGGGNDCGLASTQVLARMLCALFGHSACFLTGKKARISLLLFDAGRVYAPKLELWSHCKLPIAPVSFLVAGIRSKARTRSNINLGHFLFGPAPLRSYYRYALTLHLPQKACRPQTAERTADF